MCDFCTQKAEGMAALARFFRDAAAETRQAAYRAQMTKAAADLDRLCRRYRARCQCGSPRSQGAARQPVAEPAAPGPLCRCAPAKTRHRDARGRIAA